MNAYAYAKERYAQIGIDVEAVAVLHGNADGKLPLCAERVFYLDDYRKSDLVCSKSRNLFVKRRREIAREHLADVHFKRKPLCDNRTAVAYHDKKKRMTVSFG